VHYPFHTRDLNQFSDLCIHIKYVSKHIHIGYMGTTATATLKR